MELQKLILQKLTNDEKFCRTALPFLKQKYFDDQYKVVYGIFLDYVVKYNKIPEPTALKIDLEGKSDEIHEKEYLEAHKLISELTTNPSVKPDYLLNVTEKFCQQQAIELALIDSIHIVEGKDSKRDKGAIPEILNEALGVTFDRSIGHDYLEDWEKRLDFYNEEHEHIPLGVEIFDRITKGGVVRKSLNILMADTGVGKTIFLCNFAANILSQGKNVLYITLEMAEEKIAERIDAKLTNTNIEEFQGIKKDVYGSKMAKLLKKSTGKLIIKEYPTSTAHAGHFRSLLGELKLKKQFVPDAICIDYLNICASFRLKGNDSMYGYVKAIAEEVRGLGVESDVPIMTATQVNRGGHGSSDLGLDNISESYGVAHTADLFVALMQTPELEEQGQVLGSQLKNRYNDKNKPSKFLVGVDKNKMNVYDLEDSAQEAIVGASGEDAPMPKVPSKKKDKKLNYKDLNYQE